MVHRYLGGHLRKIQGQQGTKIASSWLSYVEQWGLVGETTSYSEDFDGGSHKTPMAKCFPYRSSKFITLLV